MTDQTARAEEDGQEAQAGPSEQARTAAPSTALEREHAEMKDRPELRNTAESGVKALIDGIELTERELLKALEKNGVRQFTPQGEKFDPNLHQAMFEIPDASVPAGSVVQVVQPGYMIGDRVLRPALVGVSKGGPKTAPSAPSNDNAKSAKELAGKS